VTAKGSLPARTVLNCGERPQAGEFAEQMGSFLNSQSRHFVTSVDNLVR